MNVRMLTAGLFALVVSGSAVAAPATFEGTVAMNMQHGDKSAVMTYMIKGDKLRIDMPAGGPHGGGSIVMDTKREVMIMLMPEQQMYMEMPMHQPAAVQAKAAKAKVTKTGKKETILGYVCEEWRIESESTVTEAWVAKGVGNFRGLGGPMGQAPRPAWEIELSREGGFPFRTIMHDASGAETSRMTVTAVEKKALADSLFTPPADWKKFEMPAGHPGMGGAAPQ